MMKWIWKKQVLCLMAIGFAAALSWMAHDSEKRPPGATYSQFLREVRQGNVESVTIAPQTSGVNAATYRTKDGHQVSTVLPLDYRDAAAAMEIGSVEIEIRDAAIWPLKNAIPFLVLAGVWLFMMGKLRSGTRIA